MSDVGEHKVLIFTITFLLIFFSLISDLFLSPNNIILAKQTSSPDAYAVYQPPNRWQFRDLETSNITVAYEDISLDYPERYACSANVSDIIDYVEWGYVLAYPIPNQLTIYFSHSNVVKYTAYRDYVISIEEDNWSMIYLDHITTDYSVRLSFSYNTNFYDSLAEAWDSGHIIILIELVQIVEHSTAFNLWSMFSQIMLFQSPSINPILDYFIAIPIWACIGISALYILNKLRDLLPAWM